MVTLETEIITIIFAWTQASDEGNRVNRGDFAGLNVLARLASGPDSNVGWVDQGWVAALRSKLHKP
jgi:hypothetical protein